MENEYSKLYDATYKKVFSKLENEIKDVIIDQHNKYSGFQLVFDLVYKDIVDKIADLYINQSDKFKKVIDWYLVRYDVKRKEAICLIYEDQMYTEFKLIEGIKSNYTYLSFIKEFASNNALVEIKRIWYGGSSIYKLMYEVNDFTDFKICKEYFGHPEHLIEFKKLLYKKFKSQNHDIYGSFKNFVNGQPTIKAEIVKFLIKNKYKKHLGRLYEDLKIDFINEQLTKKIDFINVLTDNSKGNNSKIYFSNFDYYSAHILRELEFLFKELNFINIAKSGKFMKKNEKPFARTGLSHSNTKFKQNLENSKNHVPFANLNNKIIKIIEGLKSI